jgi:hypothetical protein
MNFYKCQKCISLCLKKGDPQPFIPLYTDISPITPLSLNPTMQLCVYSTYTGYVEEAMTVQHDLSRPANNSY